MEPFIVSTISPKAIASLVHLGQHIVMDLAPNTGAFSEAFLEEFIRVVGLLDKDKIETLIENLVDLRSRAGRLFIVGMGGSAANAQHAANDFRKLAGIEAYSCSDNLAEFSALANDEGLENTFVSSLRASKFSANDCLFVLSVGGGSINPSVSASICKAVDHASNLGSKILGIVGRDGGYTSSLSSEVCVVPMINPENVTPIAETIQALVWHLLVSHPKLKVGKTKW